MHKGRLFETPRNASFPHFNPASSIMEHANKNSDFPAWSEHGSPETEDMLVGVFFAKKNKENEHGD